MVKQTSTPASSPAPAPNTPSTPLAGASVDSAASPDNGVAPAKDFDPAGAPVQIVPDVDPSHPAVDNDPRANTTAEQNRIDFNDPTLSGAEAVAKNLEAQSKDRSPMLRPPVRVTAPAQLPVSLADAKAACRVTDDSLDAAITLQVQAATDRLDGYRGKLGRALINQEWRQDFGFAPCVPLRLRFPDVSEATGAWIDEAGAESAVDLVLDEDVIGPFVRVVGVMGGVARRVLRVTYTAGYGDEPEDVPAAIRQAILMDVAHRFQMTTEDGRIRSEEVDGVGTTSFNSPEQTGLSISREIADLLKDFRRGNVL